MSKQIYVIGGGTVAHIRPHLAISAPAYGQTVRDIFGAFYDNGKDSYDGIVHLRNADPRAVINFIGAKWDLSRSTSEVEALA